MPELCACLRSSCIQCCTLCIPPDFSVGADGPHIYIQIGHWINGQCKHRSSLDSDDAGYPAIASLADEILWGGLVDVHQKGQTWMLNIDCGSIGKKCRCALHALCKFCVDILPLSIDPGSIHMLS